MYLDVTYVYMSRGPYLHIKGGGTHTRPEVLKEGFYLVLFLLFIIEITSLWTVCDGSRSLVPIVVITIPYNCGTLLLP